MNPSKHLLLNLYYYGSLPYRAWRNRQRERTGHAPAIVLFYHRIADDKANDWTASNTIFERQMRYLQKHYELVTLAEAQRRVAAGRNERTCVAITFDDGYADNCTRALPFLIRNGIPCTYFVSTQHVLEGVPFAHDVACGRPMPVNTPEQIRSLARAGIEIGAHTRTHVNMGSVTDPDRLHEELVVARDELEQMIDGPVRYFAFPYGQPMHMSAAAFQMARDVGYQAVCSAYGGYNFPGDDPFHLQRIHVDNDLIRLKNWLSVDPYKICRVKRYEYQSVGTATDTLVGANS